MNILISGAGIAGPAAALALSQAGHRTTVVERAPALRDGGQAVDFRGEVHRRALEALGLWDAIVARQTHGGALQVVDAHGAPRVTLPEVMMGGDVEIVRGDLVHLLHERTAERTEYRFGDTLTGLQQDGAGVDVTFARGAPARYDLVVGADGLHSGVRALVLGDEARFVKHHGYCLATFAVPLDTSGPSRLYSEPGRAVMLGGRRALLVFAHDGRTVTREPDAQKALVRRVYEGMGWHAPAVLAAMEGAGDFYFDSLASVHTPTYSQGRVVLVGDAAAGATLGGQGSGLAMVCARVLAGELTAAGGDFAVAFARYEQRLRPYATGCQQGAANAGPFFAPKTAWGVALRDVVYRLLTTRPMQAVFERMVKSAARSFELPEYAR